MPELSKYFKKATEESFTPMIVHFSLQETADNMISLWWAMFPSSSGMGSPWGSCVGYSK